MPRIHGPSFEDEVNRYLMDGEITDEDAAALLKRYPNLSTGSLGALHERIVMRRLEAQGHSAEYTKNNAKLVDIVSSSGPAGRRVRWEWQVKTATRMLTKKYGEYWKLHVQPIILEKLLTGDPHYLLACVVRHSHRAQILVVSAESNFTVWRGKREPYPWLGPETAQPRPLPPLVLEDDVSAKGRRYCWLCVFADGGGNTYLSRWPVGEGHSSSP